MTTLKSINDFFLQKNIAIAGVSRKKHKFGNTIYKELKKKGFKVFPVNPNMEEYKGEKCYNDIASLPDNVTGLVINTKPDITEQIIKKAINKNIMHIWLQQGAESKEAISIASKSNINCIYKECILMFAEPVVSIHRVHRWFNKVFGKYPN
ncbi:MAG: CoA-binding protein [Bacteroidales bacterium]|nr:CoA-binding protein [Bacteroidales bacterium]